MPKDFILGHFYPDEQKTPALAVVECASVWSGCRPIWRLLGTTGLSVGLHKFPLQNPFR